MNNNLDKLVKHVLEESVKLNFAGHSYLMKVDANEDPTKAGVRVTFTPTEFGNVNPSELNDIAIELESRLEKGLAQYGLRVERDRAIKDKTAIRFIIYIEYFERLFKKALKSQNPGEDEESAALPGESDIK